MTRIVIALSYYAPYVSGLTNVARDIAEGLASRGHEVTVVTSRHDDSLPLEEEIAGVRVVRCPVRLRFGKGVVAPSFLSTVVREARSADVVNLHLPMLEAGPIAAVVARRTDAAIVPTYHCDVALPASLVNSVQRAVIDQSSRFAVRASQAVVVTSDDYADSSRIAADLRRGRVVIPPGCHRRTGGAPTYRETAGLHVGFLGRLVEEKGIEYLVRGFSALADPDARLLIGGDFSAVAGGSVIDRVRAAIGDDERIKVLGFVPEDRMSDFYASLDVFALTSVNSFEAFGIVQVEAMIAGAPALASDLPGVRQPVHATGFGVVVPPRDSKAITDGLAAISSTRFDAETMAAHADELFGLPGVLDRYEELFDRIPRAQRSR
jgi:glycosyltransferase involved in cell wall biosynthesis